MVPLSSAVHMDGSRPHLRGSLNALELGALAPVRPPFPKVVQAFLGKGGWNQGSVRVSSVTCGFYDQTLWYLCCAMVERLRFSNWKKSDLPVHSQTGHCQSATCTPEYPCALLKFQQRHCESSTALDQSKGNDYHRCVHIDTIVLQTVDLVIKRGLRGFSEVTFPSFAVNSDDVPGVSSHPLPHVGGVLQHVPETWRTSHRSTMEPSGGPAKWRTLWVVV